MYTKRRFTSLIQKRATHEQRNLCSVFCESILISAVPRSFLLVDLVITLLLASCSFLSENRSKSKSTTNSKGDGQAAPQTEASSEGESES